MKYFKGWLTPSTSIALAGLMFAMFLAVKAIIQLLTFIKF